jgi:hypothetical protein
MSRFYTFVTLDDAFHLLNELRGLPDIPRSATRQLRLIRVTMVFSWIAVEEALSDFIDTYALTARADFPKGAKLLQLIEYVAKTNGKAVEVDRLGAARNLRNDVTHVRSESVLTQAATEDNCRFVFEICLAAIRAMARHEVLVDFSSRFESAWVEALLPRDRGQR